jgi:hypothetical protein
MFSPSTVTLTLLSLNRGCRLLLLWLAQQAVCATIIAFQCVEQHART